MANRIEESSISVKVTGFAVVETLKVKLKLSKADKERYVENPEKVIKELLKAAGHVVNGVSIGRSVGKGMYHIAYPEDQKSLWIWA